MTYIPSLKKRTYPNRRAARPAAVKQHYSPFGRENLYGSPAAAGHKIRLRIRLHSPRSQTAEMAVQKMSPKALSLCPWPNGKGMQVKKKLRRWGMESIWLYGKSGLRSRQYIRCIGVFVKIDTVAFRRKPIGTSYQTLEGPKKSHQFYCGRGTTGSASHVDA